MVSVSKVRETPIFEHLPVCRYDAVGRANRLGEDALRWPSELVLEPIGAELHEAFEVNTPKRQTIGTSDIG